MLKSGSAGPKKIIWQKLKMLDYTTPKQDLPPTHIYLRNTISLKGLEPGDYDLIIILHDEVNEGRTATQVVKFRVIPADDPQKECRRRARRTKLRPRRTLRRPNDVRRNSRGLELSAVKLLA